MRPADMHLTPQELESLLFRAVDSIDGNAAGALALEAQQHLSGCAVCQSVADRYHYVEASLKGLRSRGKESLSPPVGRTHCPAEKVWPSLAAGLIKKDEAARYVTHAAQCDWCGPLLKESMDDLAPDVTGEEDELLAKLPSASAGWQQEMGKKMAAGIRSSDTEALADKAAESQKGRGVTEEKSAAIAWWPRLAWAGASLALVAAAVWFVWLKTREPNVDQLLAQASADHRTLEMRFDGAAHSNRVVTRGAFSDNSTSSRPLALLEAESMIAHRLQREPDNAHWLQMRSRADVLEGHADAAVKNLKPLVEQSRNDNSLRLDLAIAFFARAEVTNNTADYNDSLALLEKVLQSDPRNPTALFNEGIVLERLFFFQGAINAWNNYLAVDPYSPWADEARVNLQRVKQRLAERGQRSQVPLLTPGEYARIMGLADEEDISALDQRAERYFDAAMRSWLPQAYTQSNAAPGAALDAQNALAGLAILLKNRHDDEWLAEFLEQIKSAKQEKAIVDLVSSSDAVRVGRYERGVLMARRSLSEFQQSRNRAAVLWSDFALMYADTFSLHYADCIRVGSAALRQAQDTHYRWLQAQMTIQLGVCQASAAHMQEAINTEFAGARLSEKFHYPSLALRANSFAATGSLYAGNFNRSLNEIARNLAIFWQSDVSDTRGQNLYAALSDFASVRNWPHTNAFATAELLADFPSKDMLDEAIEYQLLALAQEDADNHAAAQAALQKASSLLAVVPDDQAVVIRKGEMALQNARICLHLGDAQGALALLDEFRQQFNTIDSGQFQGEYFKTYGESLLALGRKSEALAPLQQALTITERYLAGFRQEAARLTWSRLQSELYRDILTIKLNSGDAAEALAWWEWYKGASLRTSFDAHAKAKTIRSISLAASPLSSYTLPQGTVLISYVLFPTRAIAFVFHEGKTTIYTLPLGDDIEPLILRFLRHCSTPNSDLQVLESESSRLYKILIAPLEANLRGSTALQIETDGVLDRVPFDLLHEVHGEYLADRFNLTFSPGLAYNLAAARESLSHESSALIVAVGNAQGSDLPALPEAAQEGIDMASQFRHVKLMVEGRVTREQLLRNLSDASLFHFAGHAVANAMTVGLVLGQDSIFDAQGLATVDLHKLQLAVLSGCDTANGGDGAFTDVNSLARTFIGARVPSVLASRWRVDSDATRQLMHLFYASLLSGKTPTSALRAATTVLRNKSGYQNPYYWGSFAVFGRS
jgi:CHAT domain-containing protein/tetratricopeptide (TPR) repeat protein